MRTILKWLGGVLAVAVLLAGALFVNIWYFKPLRIDWFFESTMLKAIADDPELLTQLGLFEQFGLTGHRSRLTDASPARTEEVARLAREQLAILHRYDRDELDASQRLSYDILEFYMRSQVDGERWNYHDYPVNQLFGVQLELPRFMLMDNPIESEAQARDYVARLSRFDTKFAQVMESLKLRESRGVLPPRFVVERVITGLEEFIAPASTDHVLYRHLADTEWTALRPEAAAAVDNKVYPAYRELLAYFESLRGKVSDDYGVWKLPDGDAYYDHLVRLHTTTDVDAETVHQRGLAEVARIEAEMDSILRGLGQTEGTVGARMTTMQTDPSQLYSNDDAGRTAIVADYQRHIDEIDARIGDSFNHRPDAKVVVVRIPEFAEKTSPLARYQPPALDGSRPGQFLINLHDLGALPKFGMRTLVYHEAVPGHHFQLALAGELKGVPTFRRVVPFTAYSEGWGLYSERLAGELGYTSDPRDDLGRLQSEMFRAVRLVVDTGIHRKRWTREQSIAYMIDKIGMSEDEVVAEIERYFVMPGQALSYKTGMTKILDLREKAHRALGEKFDIKAFHDVVLLNGAMPLGVLEQQVDQWIDDTL